MARCECGAVAHDPVPLLPKPSLRMGAAKRNDAAAGRDDDCMVQKIQTILIDDLDPELEASGTVVFALDGATYEIDLSAEHADQLRETFAPYVGAARHVGGRRGIRTPPAAGRTGRTPSAARRDSSPDAGAIRAWAREHGVPVNERGRIKGAVVAQFLEATAT